jgi:hypothetical protein
MVEEKREEKKRLQHSSKFLQEFRDSLPRSVAPVLLTLLGALAFHNAVTTFNFFAEEKQMTERLEFERSRDLSLIQNEGLMREAIVKTVPIAHAKLIGEFQSAIPTMNDAKRTRFVERLLAAVNEANGNLGALEGYTGLESTLPPNWLASYIEFFSADLESTQTALSCAERPLEGNNAKQECLIPMRRHFSRVDRALGRIQAAEKAATATKSMLEADRTHRWSMGQSELDMFFRKARWAFYGLILSLFGYAVLFHYFVLSEESTRNRQLKEGTKNINVAE